MNYPLQFTKTTALTYWLKIPYFSIASTFSSLRYVAIKALLQLPLSDAHTKLLSIRAKKLQVRTQHLDSKIEAACHYYIYRKHLVQSIINLPKLMVIDSGADMKQAKQYLSHLKNSLSLEVTQQNYFISQCDKADQKLSSSVKGVCLGMTTKFAADFLVNRKDWLTLTKKAQDGASSKITAIQATYEALKQTTSDLEDLPQLSYRIKLNQICSNTQDFDDKMLSFSKKAHGLYKMIFATKKHAHSILVYKEQNQTIIIDPNIGLLTCSPYQTEKLLKKIINSYPKDSKSKINRRLLINQVSSISKKEAQRRIAARINGSFATYARTVKI